MTEKFKILGQYIKDMSSETKDTETYIFVKDNILKYQLNININSKPLKNKMIEINTILKFEDKEETKHKSHFEMTYATIIKVDDDVKVRGVGRVRARHKRELSQNEYSTAQRGPAHRVCATYKQAHVLQAHDTFAQTGRTAANTSRPTPTPHSSHEASPACLRGLVEYRGGLNSRRRSRACRRRPEQGSCARTLGWIGVSAG